MPEGCWVLCMGRLTKVARTGRRPARGSTPRREDRPVTGPRRGGEEGGPPRARFQRYTLGVAGPAARGQVGGSLHTDGPGGGGARCPRPCAPPASPPITARIDRESS